MAYCSKSETMEEMDHQTVSPSKSPRQQEVRLKVVDDNLQTLKDYPERVQLRLKCDPVNNRCIIEFHEGINYSIFD